MSQAVVILTQDQWSAIKNICVAADDYCTEVESPAPDLLMRRKCREDLFLALRKFEDKYGRAFTPPTLDLP
jgi:hypothetical protein